MDGTRRLTLREAAEAMGISPEAVRKRTLRGTIPSDVGADGRRYVYLDDGRDGVGGAAGRRRRGSTVAGGADRTSELIATLREQLQAERKANEENRRIIAALTSRIPELPPASSQEPPGASESVFEGAGRVSDRGHAPGAQEGSERVPWWRRMFGA